jgi:hypothetical protein
MAHGKPRDPRKEQHWRSLIHLWKNSGLSVRAFCARHHITQPSFYSWRRELQQRDGPQQFLANYQGYLHADAFSGYDRLYLPDPRTTAARITEVACNAHARRKFYEARSSDALRSHQILAYYRQLYVLEPQAKDFNDEQRLQMRQELSLPILEQFHQWLLAQRPEVLPKSPMGEAIAYALNNWRRRGFIPKQTSWPSTATWPNAR